ncbi:hypothetical protein CTI12_AA554800 [Artemisia annua]|uniref:Ulp1 protease family, C-terminal catalytic domain-containing protein n=1 Tax=Artemisia annua TaxID=35608 RepID=A0A2U1KR28_ARTAN|nr:hypothetical protein CTI12_AA554800 [Artemisia annua]
MRNIDTSFNRSKKKTEFGILKKKSLVRRSERLNLQKGRNDVISKKTSRRTSERLKNVVKSISSGTHVEDQVRVIDESTLTIRTRGSPSQLFYLLSNMSPQQRNVVSKMGFSSLLAMKVCVIPSRLGFKAVDLFDEHSMSLNLKSGGIKINRETVNAIMGFPMGKEKIKYIKRVRTNNPTIISWRNQFHRYKNSKETNIRVTEVVNVILDNDFDDDIKKLDWCSYPLECLKDSKQKWNKYDTSGANYYRGPVTFLSLLYAEAILKQQKKKRQEGPAIEYWNSDLLYEVQKADRMLNEYEEAVDVNITGKKGVKSYERSHTFKKIKVASMNDSNTPQQNHDENVPGKASADDCLDKASEELFVSPPNKRQRMFRARKAKELPNGEGQKQNPIIV